MAIFQNTVPFCAPFNTGNSKIITVFTVNTVNFHTNSLTKTPFSSDSLEVKYVFNEL